MGIRDNQYNIQSRQYTEKPFTVQGLRNFELYNSQPVISQKKAEIIPLQAPQATSKREASSPYPSTTHLPPPITSLLTLSKNVLHLIYLVTYRTVLTQLSLNTPGFVASSYHDLYCFQPAKVPHSFRNPHCTNFQLLLSDERMRAGPTSLLIRGGKQDQEDTVVLLVQSCQPSISLALDLRLRAVPGARILSFMSTPNILWT